MKNFYTFNVLFTVGAHLALLKMVQNAQIYLDDVCSDINGQRIYLEHGEAGTLEAKYENNLFNSSRISHKKNDTLKRCSIEFVTCPSCIVEIKFKFLNISRNCGKATVFDTCGCDYVWIYEPSFEQVSGEQFCGHFIINNSTSLHYSSRTRKVAITFLYNKDYGHAFTLEYLSERNKIYLTGFPKPSNINNASQTISSPFFPNLYPSDLNSEHALSCETTEKCRISLVFTDFQIHDSSIIEFFDWNGQRIYATTGNIFRPPVIISSGPSLAVRFYANGATNFGFKATYSFILGNLTDTQFKPDIDCGGPVGNLGGGITMMNMVVEGSKLFDCVWLIKPPGAYLHLKTHLYVKVITFANFAGSTELMIHQGLTTDGLVAENLRLPLAHFYDFQSKEHVVPITQGFYVSLKGLFTTNSRLVIVYAAFNYKDCFTGSDFLCNNLRCIPTLLNCDGFDHCGDNSDESATSCSKDPRDRRQRSKTPNFLFPKVEGYSDLTTATLIFLLGSFGLTGLVFAMVILMYRINLKTRHQRQLQNHLETIHAILEEGVGEVEEEIIISDDPPDYEPPPEYDDIIKSTGESKTVNKSVATFTKSERCSRCNPSLSGRTSAAPAEQNCSQDASKGCRTIPDSPPPAYQKHENAIPGKETANSGVAGPSGVEQERSIRGWKFNKGVNGRRARSSPRSRKKLGLLVAPSWVSDSELCELRHENEKSGLTVKSLSLNDVTWFM